MNIAKIRAHVACRRRVGEKQRLLVAYSFRHDKAVVVSEGHADIFGVRASVAAKGVAIGVNAAGRVAQHRFTLLPLRISVVAAGGQLMLAVPAGAAGDKRGHHDAIATANIFHRAADFDHLAHKFMPENIALAHAGDQAVDDVEIGAAGGR